MKSDASHGSFTLRTLFSTPFFSAFGADAIFSVTSSAQNKHIICVVVVQVPWINAISVYGVAVVSSFDFVGILQVCSPDNRFDSTSDLGF